MALDPAYVGHLFPATPPYLVGREKIREFATAIGAMDPIYHDPDAAKAFGHPDVIAPPTFPIVITAAVIEQLIAHPGLGLDFSRVVHGDQRYTYHRPVRAGDCLICAGRIAEITERGGHQFLTVRTEIKTDLDELVATAQTKLVIRGEG